MQTITYTDKSVLNENAGIPDTNKCKAADMNEIKTVVNANANEFDSKKYCRLALNTNASIPANTYTQVIFNQTISSLNGVTLNSGGGMKFPSDGVANLNVRVRVGVDSTVNLAIKKNSESDYLVMANQTVKAYNIVTLSTNLEVSANDVFYVYIYSDVANTVIGTGTDPIWVQFDGVLI